MSWSEDDKKYGRKVAYVRKEWVKGRGMVEWKSTAYLNDEVAPDVYIGHNKHTDEPVRVRWDEATSQYIEVLPYTAKISMENPAYYELYTPEGRLFRVCHKDRLGERLFELNKELP